MTRHQARKLRRLKMKYLYLQDIADGYQRQIYRAQTDYWREVAGGHAKKANDRRDRASDKYYAYQKKIGVFS